jgi:peptide/nickel transport system substrate-binding protein
VNKYIRWQALLTLLGIVLVGMLLMRMTMGQEVVTPVPPTPTMTIKTTVIQTRGGTFIEGVAGAPRFINPLFSQENELDRDLCALVFEALTRLNERNEIVPLLARRWDVSEDGLTYTFYLRDSVRWQDGQPLTADDVVFTIGLLQSPDFPGSPYLSELWRSVDVTKIDAYTVQFTLLEAYAPFLDHTTIGLVPKHVLADVPVAELLQHEFNVFPLGAGLFRVVEHTPEYILLEANAHHRDWEQTQLDHIEFRFYPSYEYLLTAYEAGEITGVSRILPEDMDRARSNPNLQLLSARLSGFSLIFLNLNDSGKPFFRDQRVRQALLYALDRQSLIDDALGGQGLVLHSPIMPQSWAYNPEIEQYAYDPQRAIALLEEAGWTLPEPTRGTFPESQPGETWVRVKKGEQLEFTLLVNDLPDRIALAQAVAEQLQGVGVRVYVEAVGVSDLLLNHLGPRAFDAVLLQWQLPPDPDPYPIWHSTQAGEGGQNYSGFVNRDADEAIEVARLMNDMGKRTELYHQFQEIFAEQVPALLLYQPIYLYGVDRRVRDVQIAPMPDPSGRFRSISRWALLEKEVLLSDLNDQVGDTLDKRHHSWYDNARP